MTNANYGEQQFTFEEEPALARLATSEDDCHLFLAELWACARRRGGGGDGLISLFSLLMNELGMPLYDCIWTVQPLVTSSSVPDREKAKALWPFIEARFGKSDKS